MNNVFLVPKKFDKWSKNVITGSFPVKFPSSKILLDNFYCPKRFIFEFLFLSYRAHYRRYQHFRGFWQSTTSSYRDC